MSNIEWLKEVADYPIRCNLKYMQNEKVSLLYEERLLEHPQIQYWLNQLKEATSRPVSKIHGSHDYRYENIMGKLFQLGIRSNMETFNQYMVVYLDFLNDHIKRERCKDIYFGEIYANYDYELIIATFLSMIGYKDEYAVKVVTQKRIKILYEFAKEKNYNIYTDGQKYKGVKKEWQSTLIDPKYYLDSNIAIPTIHDYFLFSTVYRDSDDDTKEKIDVIVSWLFNDKCNDIKRRYGYFYFPNDSRKAKAVCWKLVIPEISQVITENRCPPELVQTVFLLSHFKASKKSSWFINLVNYLESFKNSEGRYKFKKSMLVEQTDGFYVFGKHMGVGENRNDSRWVEIESTYWMEKILQNIKYVD